MTTDNISTVACLLCQHCDGIITSSDRFCGHCGIEIANAPELAPARKEDVLKVLTPTLTFYFTTLVLIATYGLTDLFPEGFEGLVIISVMDIILVIIFCGFYLRELRPLLSLYNIKAGVMALTVAGSAIAGVFVTGLAEVIQFSIQDDVFYSTYLFEDTSHPLMWAILFICVQPALFEEVAFRGFLYSNLEKVASAKSAIYITAFIFGIIHLAVISMLWLVPGGLIFAFMRMKYKTLWYGIVGHFTYNFVITLIDFSGLLN